MSELLLPQDSAPGDLAATPTTTGAEDHVFLIGRPPLGAYLGFVAQYAVGGHAADQRTLAAEWRAANDHIHVLEQAEAGWADAPSINPLPDSLRRLRDLVFEDPICQRSFFMVPIEIAMIELERLVVFQKFINLDYVRRLKERLGPAPSEVDVFRFCLPWDHPAPEVKVARSGDNSWVFVSPSKDFRFLEPALLRGDQIPTYAPQGPVSGVVALVVGFGSNFLNAIHAENRLVLNNGSHRAFALRDAGVTRVPCIVQRVTRREELEMCPAVQQNPDLYLKHPRPPVLKDYFDPQLRKVIPVPRQLRQVKVAFGVETIDVPAP